MSKTQIMHFDSLSGVYNTSRQNNSYAFDNSNANNSYNSYNADYKLPYALHNVKQIKLKSVEIPVKINSVRANSNTNIFYYSADNITYKSFTLIFKISSFDVNLIL